MPKKTGLFVSVDGPNGVGKSTLIKAVYRYLTRRGFRVHLTKELTKTTLGQFVRRHHTDYRGKTLALLLAADRQNHIEKDILAALEKYDIVITDRYVDSSLVFQRLDGVGLQFLWKLNEHFLRPDLSVIVLATAKIIVSRMARRKSLDRFEQSFGSKEELRLFRAAASFMKKKGFNVLKFDNGRTSVENGAKKLSEEMVQLTQKHKGHI